MYDHISQFEPLLPAEHVRPALLEKAHTLQRLALSATGRAHPLAMATLAPLLRKMNSYYTNRIEVQHTLPLEIDAALARQYSADAEVEHRQRLALAHMETESWAETKLGWHKDWRALLGADTITALHKHLFAQLPSEHGTDENGGLIAPGALRAHEQKEVIVGQHVAPKAASVPQFLDRMEAVYKQPCGGDLPILAVAAMHHRLAWVHPFMDGNGRVARLHSHLLLYAMGLTNGVWSPLRGLARTQDRYYQALAAADMPRQGDLDGRGNLSEQGLVRFIDYFLDVCIDQAQFMGKMLDLRTLDQRISACLAYESHRPNSDIKMEAVLPLSHLFTHEQLDRGQFKRMTGLGLRASERLLKGLLDRGLLVSDSPKGALKFGIPLHALRFYFPELWPEAEIDASRIA
jgi:Fic family protein